MTRPLVAIASALGLVVPLWTMGFYPAADLFSRVLIALIVTGLVIGFVELWRRARTVDRLTGELALLEGDAASLDERLEKGSERFRRLVAARLRGATALLDGTVFTPYLVSVLVLVGLLGTFVGLVETLAGARDALSSSAEIDALRNALLAPMRGLSRAFGTSVAGVSASAMLGLAAVFVRRAEGRFFATLNGYMASTLSSRTLVARQVAALERLGEQGDALPRAVEGLAQVATRLPALEESMMDGHKELSRAVREAIEASAKEVSQTLARGVEGASKAHEDMVERVIERAASLLEERVQQVTSKLDEDIAARRAADEHQRKAFAESSSESLGAFDSALQKLLSLEEERASSLRSLLEERARKEAARDEQVQKVLEEAGALSRDAIARLESLAELQQKAASDEREAIARLTDEASQARGAADEAAGKRLEELALHLAQLGDGQAERLTSLEARLEEDRRKVTGELAEKLASQAGEMAEELGGAVSALRTSADALSGGGVELTALADRFALAVDEYKGASELWIDKLTTLEAALGTSGRGDDDRERFGAYLDQTREVFDRSLELQRELFAGLKAQQQDAPAEEGDDGDAKGDTGAAA